MALVKRFSSLYLIYELKQLKSGYKILEKSPDKQGEFEVVSSHSRIKSLSDASSTLNGLVKDAEINMGIKFSVYSSY
jgi:hypothetical protein